MESIQEIIWAIDDSKTAALFFLTIYLSSVISCWYWAFFKNGAQKWRKGVVEYQSRIGLGDHQNFMTSETFFKVFVTLFLVFSIVGCMLGFINLINK